MTTIVGFQVIGFECTGFDPDGVRVTEFGILGEVVPGARVEGADAVVVGSDATVINEGEVGGQDVGLAGGDDVTVFNEGGIAGGAAAVEVGDFLVLRNSGAGLVEGGEVGDRHGRGPPGQQRRHDPRRGATASTARSS